MKKSIGMTLLFCVLFGACKKEVQNSLGNHTYTMEELPHKTFLLDDSTTQVLTYFYTFEENDSLRLALYNEPMKNICFFNVTSGKCTKKIQLAKEGAHAIGTNLLGFYYQNNDSLWVYKNWPEEICLLNDKGLILQKKSVDRIEKTNESILYPEVLPNANLPMRKWGDYIILQGQGKLFAEGKDRRAGVTAFYNIKKNNITAANPYPEIYGDDKIWQSFAYRVVPYDIVDEENIVLSFPAEDSIRIYNIKTGANRAYFAGHSAHYKIQPAKSKSMKDVERHVLKQVQYAGIYHDKWNKLYYRLMTLPVSDYDKNIGANLPRELCVIILDERFCKVGEYKVKERSHLYSHCFVSPDGLHINVLSDDDDYLAFMTVKPVGL